MKKRSSKILAMFCAITLALTAFGAVLPRASAAQVGEILKEGVYTAKVNPDGGSVTLTEMGNALNDRLVLPDTLGGLPVTGIGRLYDGVGGFTMKTVVIPSTVKEITSEAFASPKARTLASFEVAQGNTAFSVENGVLFSADKSVLVSYPQARTGASYAVPSEVKSIGSWAFYGAKALETVTLPQGVASLGDYAFSGSGLTGISMPASLTQLGKSVFSGCDGLTAVTLSQEEIPEGMFLSNSKLQNVTFGSTVKKIGKNAFNNCDSLAEITIPGTVTTVGESAFGSCNKLAKVTLGEGVKTIGDKAFQYIPLTKIAFPTTLESIGASAFASTQLESVSLPGSVKSVGTQAFSSTKLTSVSLPSTVTQWGDSVFSGCKELLTATVEQGVTVLPAYAFNSCSMLSDVSLPQGLLSVGKAAFEQCSMLGKIHLPSTVTSLGARAFKDCPIRSVELPDGITLLDENVFQGCQKLQSVKLPAGLKEMRSGSLAYCSALQSLTIPAGVDTINVSAFSYSQNLREIILQGNAPKNVTSDPFPQVNGREIYRSASATGYDQAPWNTMDVKALEERPEDLEKKPIDIKLTASLAHSRQDELILWLTMDVTPQYYDDAAVLSPAGAVTTYLAVDGGQPRMLPEPTYFLGGNTPTSRTFGYNMKEYENKSISVFITMDASTGFQAGTSNTVTGPVGALSDLNWDEYKPFGDSQGGANGFEDPVYGYEDDLAGNGVVLTSLDSREATASTIFLPETLDGKTVVALGNGLLQGCARLSSVSIPDTVTEIGEACFADCGSLKEIVLPAGLKAIHAGAFTPSGLKKVTLLGDAPALDNDVSPFPEGVKLTVGEQAAGYDQEPWKTLLGTKEPDAADQPSGGSVVPRPTPVPENPEEPVVETVTTEDGGTATTVKWPDGKTAVAVKSPEGDKSITVNTAQGETLAAISLPASPEPAKSFQDVGEKDWYKESVDTATSLGLFQGTEEDQFGPALPLSRGMLATVLYRLGGEVEFGSEETGFPDVEEGKFYAKAAGWAESAGIIAGTESGFQPEDNVTREQLVTILYRFATVVGAAEKEFASLSGFPDGDNVSSYAQEAMSWAIAQGLIQGKDGKIVPNGSATRAEVATVLARFTAYLSR